MFPLSLKYKNTTFVYKILDYMEDKDISIFFPFFLFFIFRELINSVIQSVQINEQTIQNIILKKIFKVFRI